MEALATIIGLIFLTPFGWIGMICFGIMIDMIRD